MSKKKSPLLIYSVEGDPGTCFECHEDEKRRVTHVVHHNIKYASKKDKKEYRGVVKKGVERFLCRTCYLVNWLNDPMKYSQGQAEFTSVSITDWRKISYHHK